MLLSKTRTLALALALLGAACSRGASSEASPPPSPPRETNTVTIVEDPSLVCMVNNTYMAAPQDRVVVDGRSYYGCCPACRDRLTTEPAVRTARDPVSGEVVDKASAVLARDDRNGILYFASAEHARQYRVAR